MEKLDLNDYSQFWKRGLISVARRMPYALFQHRLNQAVRQKCNVRKFDFIVCEKPKYLTVSTLKLMKLSTDYLIHFSPDDYFNPSNQGWFDDSRLQLFDVIVTNKLHNIQPLAKKFGQHKVYHMLSGGPEVQLNRPKLPKDYQVSFIGQFEEDRFQVLRQLSQRIPWDIHVFGPDWNRIKAPKNLILHGPVWGEKFEETIRRSKVNLCFLRKANFDTSTNRTFEIVSNEGLLVAERTQEHRSLFEEGKEAIFFNNVDELVAKIEFCLHKENAKKIAEIAHKGIQRYILGGYSDKRIWERFFAVS